MSPKLKRGLIIGGAVVCGLCLIVVVIGVISTASTGMMGGAAAPASRGYGYAEEAAVEAPAPMEGGGGYAQSGIAVDQAAMMPTLAPTAQPGSAPGEVPPVQRLIIRNGSISMSVEDTLAARDDIEAMVEGLADEGAFVVSVSEYGGEEGSPTITMAIRVPATRFDEVMDSLAGMAVDVTARDETAQDVTEEYVDLAGRLESLETARQRLLEIMQGAAVTQELLQAEEQLTQREAEIESIRGRMQYLEQSAALSRIDITLQPYILSQPVDTSWRPAETVRRAFDALLNGLRGLADFLITFAIAILPFLALFGAIIYGVVRLVLRWIRARQARKAGE
jgi:hypothetical protein